MARTIPAPKKGAGRELNLQIPLGAATVSSADLGLGSLANAKIVCSIRQAAADGTLTEVRAIGNANGTVTVNGNANATAAVNVSVIVSTAP